METLVSWIAPIATIIAALMTAANLGARITGYGFVVFTLGSLAWLGQGIVTRQPALIWQNAVLLLLNLFGIWRWLGRQAQFDEGGKRAAHASRATAGDDLFQISLLTSAEIVDRDGRKLGQAIDAMTSCRDGRIAYLVASDGGVAGVGETLHRIEWHDARLSDGTIQTDLDAAGFAGLPALAKDRWPGR